MTTSNLSDTVAAELLPDNVNEQIAEWCGYRYTRANPDYEWFRPAAYPPPYSRDLNACAEFEALLEWRELQSEYTLALEGFVIADTIDKPLVDKPAAYIFEVATATAPQRCAALLWVIGNERRST